MLLVETMIYCRLACIEFNSVKCYFEIPTLTLFPHCNIATNRFVWLYHFAERYPDKLVDE